MLYPNCDRVLECELLDKMNERELLSKIIAENEKNKTLKEGKNCLEEGTNCKKKIDPSSSVSKAIKNRGAPT